MLELMMLLQVRCGATLPTQWLFGIPVAALSSCFPGLATEELVNDTLPVTTLKTYLPFWCLPFSQVDST